MDNQSSKQPPQPKERIGLEDGILIVVCAVLVFHVWGLQGLLGWQPLLVLGAALSFLCAWCLTKLGRWTEVSFKNGRWMRGVLQVLAIACCILWDVFAGAAATEGMARPGIEYRAAQARVDEAAKKVDDYNAALLALPQPTDRMPAKRIEEMTASNKAAAERIGIPLRKAEEDLEELKADFKAMKKPMMFPEMPLWAKALLSLLVTFLLFAIPWAASAPVERELKEGEGKPAKAQKVRPTESAQAAVQTAPQPSNNLGGWEPGTGKRWLARELAREARRQAKLAQSAENVVAIRRA